MYISMVKLLILVNSFCEILYESLFVVYDKLKAPEQLKAQAEVVT